MGVLLLSLGVQGLAVANRREALTQIEKQPDIKMAILDVDNKETEGMQLLRELRENKDTRSIKAIAYSFQSNREFIEKMVEMGVAGYLLKPLDQERAKGKLRRVIAGISAGISEKRLHIRVPPDPGELLRLHFKVPAYPNLISGKVRNISMGGIAIELLGPVKENIILTGTKIPNLNFSLNNKPLSPSAQVVLVKEKFIALRFESMSGDERSNLARYIYKRMSA